MYIPDEIVRDIKEKATILDVVQHFTSSLKKKGKDYVGECIFCNEKKLSVSPAKGLYKCWSCEKGYPDPVALLMAKENLTYPEALKWLANFYHILLPIEIPFDDTKKTKNAGNKKAAPQGQKAGDDVRGANPVDAAEPAEKSTGGTDAETDRGNPPKRKGEFFKETLRSIGITADQNKVTVKWQNRSSQAETRPFITEDRDGNIHFLVYDINGFVVTYDKKGRETPYTITRLKVPIINNKDGKLMKYIIPKGVGTRPFFPPGLLDKYDNRTKINTLFLTEGYKKSISGWINGLDIVGLSSISTYTDKQTMQLHGDIVELIIKCKVENVVVLYDGDCMNISTKALEDGKDISIRPKNFFSSATGIKELLKDHLKEHEISLYFAHVNSDSVEGHPKGLDDIYDAMVKVQHKGLIERGPIPAFPKGEGVDHQQQTNNAPYTSPIGGGKEGASLTAMQKGRMLVEAKKNTRTILNSDLLAFSKPGVYFNKINITIGLKKLEQLLGLESANTFYLKHQEIIKDKRFVYIGTQYQYDSEKGECTVIIPAAAKNYVRVGDDYFEKVPVPNKYEELETQLHRRSKTTITDDHGKHFTNHIQKFKAFCNVPNHTNYQEVLHNCFNMYSRFEHEPDEGDCPQTLDFIKHIFEEHYELGLDYLQLLYQRPQQILPILCLVSKENNTGKSTFAKWLKQIFKNNMAIVGNADLANDFNGFWSTKLVICCDEAFIEKKVIVERIKSLSTADRITMNSKGRDQVEIEFFGKFLMLTNNEDNFIYATDEDIRYWVRKVKRPAREVVNLDRQLISEIPAFLHYLNNRTMHTSIQSRMWFKPELLITDAFRNVVKNSRSTLEKELRTKLQSMFEDFSENIITMTVGEIRKEFFGNRYEEKYVLEVLRQQMKVEQWWEPEPETNKKQYKVKRYQYPKWHTDWNNGHQETKRIDVKGNGRPFVFLRPDFVPPERELLIQHDPEFLSMVQPVPAHYWRTGMLGDQPANTITEPLSELPF